MIFIIFIRGNVEMAGYSISAGGVEFQGASISEEKSRQHSTQEQQLH